MSPTVQVNSSSSMRICIDASNISSGGGLTHLVELLRVANPPDHGIQDVIIWASQATLDHIEKRSWLSKRTDTILEKNYMRRAMWQRKQLGELVKEAGCDLVFVPGGSFVTDFRPVVTMNRNLLPFEWKELRRYGLSLTTLRLLLLRWSQSRSINNADGIIFLTKYAKDAVLQGIRVPQGRTVIIPHGIDRRFFNQPHPQRLLSECSEEQPFRLVYVSIINVYKHQVEVVEAVTKLRAEGLPVALDLVGPAYLPSLSKLKKALQSVDPAGKFIHYLGVVPYTEIQNIYKQADLAVFASSCETFGQIVTEYMAAGLPIACSNRSAMPELLGEAGVYFDPEQPDDIARVLHDLIISPQLRAEKAEVSYLKAQDFSWERCSSDTFAFLAEAAHQYRDASYVES